MCSSAQKDCEGVLCLFIKGHSVSQRGSVPHFSNSVNRYTVSQSNSEPTCDFFSTTDHGPRDFPNQHEISQMLSFNFLVKRKVKLFAARENHGIRYFSFSLVPDNITMSLASSPTLANLATSCVKLSVRSGKLLLTSSANEAPPSIRPKNTGQLVPPTWKGHSSP